MCDLDAEMCAVWVETERRARKRHRCCECGTAIPKGHAYVQINSVSGGSAGTSRRHEACHKLWYWVSDLVCGQAGYSTLGGLCEEVHEAQESMCDLLPDETVKASRSPHGHDLPNPFLEAFELIQVTYEAFDAQAASK